MTARRFALTTCLAALASAPHLSATVAAQPIASAQGQPARAPTAPVATPSPAAPVPVPVPDVRPTGQALNVKIEVTITDQRGGAPTLKKTVNVVAADNMSGRIRSQALYGGLGDVPLNIDAEPFILADGKIRLRLSLQYDLPSGAGHATEPSNPPLIKTQIQENLALILENGKPLVAAQSADPVGDRQVTIEVRATVLR
jgi:hypothetical protein